MILTTIISKSFQNCIKTTKTLGKYLVHLIIAVFITQALIGIIDFVANAVGITVNRDHIITKAIFWGVWATVCVFVSWILYPNIDYDYSADSDVSNGATKYDDLPSWAKATSWLLAFAELASIAVITLCFVFTTPFDNYHLGELTLIATRFISQHENIGIDLTFIVLVFYGGAFICVMSCLSLLLPVVKYIRRRGLNVFSISGIMSIVFYTWYVFDNRAGFLIYYIGKSISWQYKDIMKQINDSAEFYGTSTGCVLEYNFILPILTTLIFNTIIYYILNRYVKGFSTNLYETISDGHHLLEGSIAPVDNYTKEQIRKIAPQYDAVFATLVWTAYGRLMNGRKLKQQYIRLGKTLDDYDPNMIAQYTDDDVQRIKKAKTIIHSESRIRSVISNAQVYCRILDEFGSFGSYFRQLINDEDDTILKHLPNGNVSLYAKLLAADLHYRGFKYIGPAKASELLKNCYKMLLK